MTINTYILSTLVILHDLHLEPIDRVLHVSKNSASVQANDLPLVTITPDSITLLDQQNMASKIIHDASSVDNWIELPQLISFFTSLKSHLLRLNHVGISYACPDIDQELQDWKKIVRASGFGLYEEDSGYPGQRWFFIGDTADYQTPLFEIVLTLNTSSHHYTKWIPHFQIHLDTDLDIDQLDALAAQYLYPNFFGWTLNVPNKGVVLGMGKLGTIRGTHLYLGLGTRKGDLKFHRQNILKPV